MRWRRRLAGAALFSMLASVPSSAAVSTSETDGSGFAACADWTGEDGGELRDLVAKHYGKMTDGDGKTELIFLVIGAESSTSASNAIVFFNGTSGIMTDWPYEMVKGEEGSLCDDYTLVFFDYPGIGGSEALGSFTFDTVAESVDALITHVNSTLASKMGATIDTVHPLGWSLGTLAALKFAGLAAENGYGASDTRKIGNLLLLATKPGGDLLSGVASWVEPAHGNQALCVTQVTHAMATNQDYYVKDVKEAMFGLTFPYVFEDGTEQGAYADETDEICEVSEIVKKDEGYEVVLVDGTTGQGIETACAHDANGTCATGWDDYVANRGSDPYRDDDGLPWDVYQQERSIVHDWNYAACPTAGSNWRSSGCVSNESATVTEARNGGVCATIVFPSSEVPIAGNCMPMDHITGEILVLNGPEDLFIQFPYGSTLTTAYKATGVPIAYELYMKQAAGHALLLTDPAWVRERLTKTMERTDSTD